MVSPYPGFPAHPKPTLSTILSLKIVPGNCVIMQRSPQTLDVDGLAPWSEEPSNEGTPLSTLQNNGAASLVVTVSSVLFV